MFEHCTAFDHRCTGLQNFDGADVSPRGVRGHAPPENFEK